LDFIESSSILLTFPVLTRTHAYVLVLRRLKLGEAFLDCSEEFATEYCEKKVAKFNEDIEALSGEEAKILERQKELKKALYSRFGKAINLEE
jgi:chaperonin cofactor prefoldin